MLLCCLPSHTQGEGGEEENVIKFSKLETPGG